MRAGCLLIQDRVIGSNNEDLDKRRLAYFKKLMTKGEVSKAFRAIMSDTKVLLKSLDGLQFFQSKSSAATSGVAPWTGTKNNASMRRTPFQSPSKESLSWSDQPRRAPRVELATPLSQSKTADEDNDQERIPHKHPALPGPTPWFLEHCVNTWPVSSGVLSFYDAGEAIRRRAWNDHDTTNRKDYHLPEDCGCCTAIVSSPGLAERVRGRSVLRRIVQSWADAELNERSSHHPFGPVLQFVCILPRRPTGQRSFPIWPGSPQQSCPQLNIAWKMCRMLSTSKVRRVQLRSSRPSVLHRARPRVGNCTA